MAFATFWSDAPRLRRVVATPWCRSFQSAVPSASGFKVPSMFARNAETFSDAWRHDGPSLCVCPSALQSGPPRLNCHRHRECQQERGQPAGRPHSHTVALDVLPNAVRRAGRPGQHRLVAEVPPMSAANSVGVP